MDSKMEIQVHDIGKPSTYMPTRVYCTVGSYVALSVCCLSGRITKIKTGHPLSALPDDMGRQVGLIANVKLLF